MLLLDPHMTQISLDEEFLTLWEAARVAYSELAPVQPRSAADYPAEAVQLVGIALSTVAPIYMTTKAGSGVFVLGAAEIEHLLFRPLKQHRPTQELDNLRIRRRDLRGAIKALKEARQSFAGRQ